MYWWSCARTSWSWSRYWWLFPSTVVNWSSRGGLAVFRVPCGRRARGRRRRRAAMFGVVLGSGGGLVEGRESSLSPHASQQLARAEASSGRPSSPASVRVRVFDAALCPPLLSYCTLLRTLLAHWNGSRSACLSRHSSRNVPCFSERRSPSLPVHVVPVMVDLGTVALRSASSRGLRSLGFVTGWSPHVHPCFIAGRHPPAWWRHAVVVSSIVRSCPCLYRRLSFVLSGFVSPTFRGCQPPAARWRREGETQDGETAEGRQARFHGSTSFMALIMRPMRPARRLQSEIHHHCQKHAESRPQCVYFLDGLGAIVRLVAT